MRKQGCITLSSLSLLASIFLSSALLSGCDSKDSDNAGNGSIPTSVTDNIKNKTLATGDRYALLVMPDGKVVAWGSGGSGELGTLSNTETLPQYVLDESDAPITGVRSVSAGYNQSYAVKNDGTVLAWGSNYYGYLSDGTNGISPYYRPRAIPVLDASGNALTNVVAVATGFNHSIALINDGTVLSWGDNFYGQLGENSYATGRNYPVVVVDESGLPLADIIDVDSRYYHNLALKADGTVYAWGANLSGQLGDGTTTQRNVATQVFMSDGSPLSSIVAVAAGRSHSLALTADGQVFSWGENYGGRLGDGTEVSRSYPGRVMEASGVSVSGVVDIAAGYYHSLLIMSDGTIKSFGLNTDGQLGDGSLVNRLYPIAVSNSASVEVSNVIAVSGGGNFSIAMKQDGTLFGFGDDLFAQICAPSSPLGNWFQVPDVLIDNNGYLLVGALP